MVHGIGGPRVIQDGDVVKIDVGVHFDGWVGDNALTVPVGNVAKETLHLLAATEESLLNAVKFARDGWMLGDLCHSVEAHVTQYGYTVVREFVGHGVGRSMHEEPQVPNFDEGKKSSPKLKPGMTIAIEPMVNIGRPDVKILKDGWTVVTQDGSLSAHFEHTIVVKTLKAEILSTFEWIEKAVAENQELVKI